MSTSNTTTVYNPSSIVAAANLGKRRAYCYYNVAAPLLVSTNNITNIIWRKQNEMDTGDARETNGTIPLPIGGEAEMVTTLRTAMNLIGGTKRNRREYKSTPHV